MDLRRMFRPEREEVEKGQRKLHSEELHIFYASPHIIRVINSRSMRWTGHVTRMGETRNAYKNSVENPEGKTHIKT